MYAMHLEPSGATYKGVKEEFLSRTPLPLTDVCVSPADGALYFVIGGRGAQSELFRVTYIGKEPTDRVEYTNQPSKERLTRLVLESFHSLLADPVKAAGYAIPQLNDPDRFVRYAARLALENHPVKFWQDKVLAAKEPEALILGVVALARQGDKSLEPKLLDTLNNINFASLPESEQLDLLARMNSSTSAWMSRRRNPRERAGPGSRARPQTPRSALPAEERQCQPRTRATPRLPEVADRGGEGRHAPEGAVEADDTGRSGGTARPQPRLRRHGRQHAQERAGPAKAPLRVRAAQRHRRLDDGPLEDLLRLPHRSADQGRRRQFPGLHHQHGEGRLHQRRRRRPSRHRSGRSP